MHPISNGRNHKDAGSYPIAFPVKSRQDCCKTTIIIGLLAAIKAPANRANLDGAFSSGLIVKIGIVWVSATFIKAPRSHGGKRI